MHSREPSAAEAQSIRANTATNRLYERGARLIRGFYDRRLHEPAVLDVARYFPDAQRFAANWQMLRAEALHVAASVARIPRFHEVMREQADISANDGRDWRMYIMQAYGVRFETNMARCPTLAALVAQSPDVLSASFSLLAPGKHIPPHRGPFRGILRGYLVLSMPRDAQGRPAVTLTVDGQPYRLQEGEFLLWDDTFEHEVNNVSDQTRIVLLLDVRRAGMPIVLRLLTRGIIVLVRCGIRLRGTKVAV
ncbi:aspartyl/asparaginyl beta-hydroxylase domain-containing protein [Trinickia soli]|uniref:aspartyl/asparaginyl beta-hydroxylase domain-containing protein n=1 Tax=Trinickia soli TaxID=380675 RepID=UPI003FA36DA2